MNLYTTKEMFYHLAIIAALAALGAAFHVDVSAADMEKYFSVSTAAEVPEYAIVSPTAYSAGGRHKRNIEFEDTHKEVKFAAFGEDFHVSLEENTELLRSGLHVKRYNADGTTDHLPLKNRRCFYHGDLLSHDMSVAAVSTCNGMSGMISTEKYDMFIQPLTDEDADKYRRSRRDVENPHVIYRRSTSTPVIKEVDGHFCALDPEVADLSGLYTNMDEMDKMHRSLGLKPVEVKVDFGDDNIDETTIDDDIETSTPVDEIETTTTVDNIETTTTDEEIGSSDESRDDENDGNDEGSSRRKRQARATKYLELRVLADADMTRYHGANDVIDYTITLMNVVAARYREPSLGRRIELTIVELGYATSDTITERAPNGAQQSFVVQVDGPTTLNAWSNFQWRTNPSSDSDPGHWDNAVLISRKNLQVNGSPNLLGIAWGNATCFLPRQANVNQDQGLSSGLVIAHEIGHNNGMNHDNDNGCTNGINVMSSHRPNGPGSFQWSTCSVVDLERFLRDPNKRCLDDVPQGAPERALNPSDRPGARISAAEQCVLQTTDRTTFVGQCTQNLANICANLFCMSSSGACWSSVAAAEGTQCGNGMICISGACVQDDSQATTYTWRTGGFGTCSVTCGNGVQTRSVTCVSSTNQQVSDNLCAGQARPATSQQCNRQTCPTFQWSAGQFGQCSVSCGNGVQTRSVTCVSSTTNQQVSESLCAGQRPTTNQLCTMQACQTFDWRTGNFGQCSVTCGTGVQSRSVTCVSSTNQQVSESLCPSTQRPSNSQQCTNSACQNFEWRTGTFGQCSVSCGTGVQTRSVTCVSSATNQPVTNSLCTIARPATSQPCTSQACQSFEWRTGAFGPCSVTCGSGVQTRTPICFLSGTNTQINEAFCSSLQRPHTSQACTQPACQNFEWRMGGFGQCSVTCGPGIQTRIVTCFRVGTNTQATDTDCNGIPKPTGTSQICNEGNCATAFWQPLNWGQCSDTTCQETRLVLCVVNTPTGNLQQAPDVNDCDASIKPPTTRSCSTSSSCRPVWVASAFSQCSASCGGGTRSRTVTCRQSASSSAILPDSQCSQSGTKPRTSESCNMQSCGPVYSWFVSSNYGACSVTCGTGVQSTLVICINSRGQRADDAQCPPPKPQGNTRSCNTGVSCGPNTSWVTSGFSQCPVTCGDGTQTRSIFCVDSTGQQRPESACDPATKPVTQQPCYNAPCPSDGVWITSNFGQCSVTCGPGTRQRTVFCQSRTANVRLQDSQCEASTKPESTQACNLATCPSNPGSAPPDQGVPCSGVYTRPVNNLRLFGNSQRGSCKAVIAAPPGQDIKLTFTECNVACNPGNYRGLLRDATADDQPFCCTGIIDPTTGTNFVWTSETHIVQLEINDRASDQGFAVKVEFVGQPRPGCDSVISAPSGTVESPNYPNWYPSYPINDEALCQTVIVAPPDMKVELTFNDLSFAKTWTFAQCSQSEDNVEVYDIDNLQGGFRYCGSSNSPNSLQKPDLNNRVLIQYNNNLDGRNHRGFQISYTFV